MTPEQAAEIIEMLVFIKTGIAVLVIFSAVVCGLAVARVLAGK